MDEGLLSLKWNNHHTTLVHLLRVLREQCFYTDAVLVCGSQFFGVHRLVLMACSDYFSDIFSQVQDCPKPVIVLQDMASSELEALLDYMYLGEVDVHQNKLPSLIKAAECLHIKGLAAIEDDPTKPLKTLLHSKVNQKTDSSSVHTISPSLRKGNLQERSSANGNNQGNESENPRKRHWSSENSRNSSSGNKFSRTDHNSSSKKASVQREPMSDSARYSSSYNESNSSTNRSNLNDCSNVSRLSEEGGNDCQYINNTQTTNIKREDGDDGCSVKREDGDVMIEHDSGDTDLLPQTGVKLEDASHHFQHYLQTSNAMDDQLFAAEAGQSGSALNAALVSLSGSPGDSAIATSLLPSDFGLPSFTSPHSLLETSYATIASSPLAAGRPQQSSNNEGSKDSLSGSPRGANSAAGDSNDLRCPQCSRLFTDKYKRDRHLLIHTGVKPYMCPFCPYRSSRKDPVIRHIKYKHIEAMTRAGLPFEGPTADSRESSNSATQGISAHTTV